MIPQKRMQTRLYDYLIHCNTFHTYNIYTMSGTISIDVAKYASSDAVRYIRSHVLHPHD